MDKTVSSAVYKDPGVHLAIHSVSLINTISSSDFILTEAAVIEALRRDISVSLHPLLEQALLIYDSKGGGVLGRLYKSFINIARQADIPILVCTPTWRANPERLQSAGIVANVNRDGAQFTLGLKKAFPTFAPRIFVGGLLGCKNDCYKPEEALSAAQAEKFHTWQSRKLAAAGVDFLMAATLPSVSEATGIARAMQRTKLPYIISFVINSSGQVLDGTELAVAFQEIDTAAGNHRPLGYMINCAYPSFLHPERQSDFVLRRLLGFQANASSKDHCDLDGSETLQMDDIHDWGQHMITLNKKHKIKVLGGCCGTSLQHLEYLVNGLCHQ
jgi:S-methylmethionine-dependent homocysteine/selenocysteine methylase